MMLVDAANSLQVTDVERILSAAIAGVLALELAVGLLLGLGLFQRLFIVSRSWRCHTQRLKALEAKGVPRTAWC